MGSLQSKLHEFNKLTNNGTYYSSIHHHANLTYTQAIGTMEPPLNSTTSSPSRKELGKYDSATVAAALAQNYLEEAQALLQALDILSQLAAMNTSDYHGTLMGRPSPDFLSSTHIWEGPRVFQLHRTSLKYKTNHDYGIRVPYRSRLCSM